MFKKIRNLMLFGALSLMVGTFGTIAATPFVIHDLADLGDKKEWTSLDKLRVKTYLESLGLAGAMLPPIGPTRGIHHVSLMGNAYLDGHLPPNSTMNFLRDVVMNSPGDGSRNNDFRSRFERHERKAMEANRRGKRVYISNIVQAVPFHRYGLPFKDHFAVTMRTDIINGEPKSSFIVWGLGIVVDHRNPSSLGGQFDSLANIFGLEGSDLIRWTCNLERSGLATPYWILITERSETSAFSHEAVNKSSRQRRSEWHEATYGLHRNGLGKSVGELYN